MEQVIKETIQYMWRSEKNRLFMFVSTLIVIIYSIFVLPNISGENEVDIKNLEREMVGNVVQFEESLNNGLLVPSALTGTTSYIQERNNYINQRELLTSLKQGDAKRYISISYRPETRDSRDQNNLEQLVFNVLAYEEEQLYQPQKNQYYINELDNLSFHTVHERTSLQQLHLFLLGLGPIIVFVGLIFLIHDVHTKDRSLKTQKIGIPMQWQKYLFIQGMTALAFVSIFYVFLLTVFMVLNSLLYGFGSLNLPVGFYAASFEQGMFNPDNYQLQTIGWFMMRTLPYLFLISYLLTRLNTMFSMWTRNSIITLFLSIFTTTFQLIYYGSEFSKGFEFDLSNFAQTYIDFGKIITGRFEQQIQVSIPNVFVKGMLILLVTILMTEILIYITAKKITRQKFVS